MTLVHFSKREMLPPAMIGSEKKLPLQAILKIKMVSRSRVRKTSSRP